MKKLLFILSAIMMIATSCNKEKKIAEKLEGTWQVIELTDKDGNQDDLSTKQIKWTFNACQNLNKYDCNGLIEYSYTTGGTGSREEITFSINNDGDVLYVNSEVTTKTYKYYIEDFSENELTIRSTNSDTWVLTKE